MKMLEPFFKTRLLMPFNSLIRNAIEALSVAESEWIRVEVDRQQIEGRQLGRLRVSDNGPGLSELEREHLFDPFFSGRQAGRGLGFGLPKCWRIVTLHHGQIDVASQPGETIATVLWPCDAE